MTMTTKATFQNILFITILTFSYGAITAQSNVEIQNLQGQGKALVYADEDGVLKRSSITNGRYYKTVSSIDFEAWYTPSPISNISNRREFFAPVHLPQNSIIKSVSFWYLDNVVPDITVELYRKDLTQQVLIFTKSVMGTPNTPQEVTIDISPTLVALIDNINYTYHMRVSCFQDGILATWPENLKFYKAIIEYEIQ
jgi:hypothetical protein